MAKFVIEGGYPLNGKVRVSGNKNEALPAIVAATLSDEDVILERVPKIEDVKTILLILQEIGVKHEWLGKETLIINAKNINSWKPNARLCDKIRASILLIGPTLSRFGKIELPCPGGDIIGARRIDSHFDIVESLGGNISFGNPIKASLPSLRSDYEVFLDEPSVTATENLLMLTAINSGTTHLYNAACEPHVVGLCNLLNKMGARIEGIGSNVLKIKGVTRLRGTKHVIGADFMEVGSFLSLGSITPGLLTLEDVDTGNLRFILKTLEKIGISPKIEKNHLLVGSNQIRSLPIKSDVSGRVSTIYSGPWPAFPTDLMSISIVAATQANGTIIFHEKMFEGRMFFTDKLMDMGANIVLCDPHRIVINGPKQLISSNMSSPDVRAGMAMIIAALCAKGTSTIDNIYQIERGYDRVYEKLKAIGAKIRRIE